MEDQAQSLRDLMSTRPAPPAGGGLAGHGPGKASPAGAAPSGAASAAFAAAAAAGTSVTSAAAPAAAAIAATAATAATAAAATAAKSLGKKTRIIAVTSGKGGVGKTNLSVNLAIAYAQLGKKVVVMDADLGLANVNVMLKMIPKYNLYHVIRKQKTMREIILDTEYGIQIVAGASGFSKIANLSEEERQNFISELYALSHADIVIIDTAAGVSSNVLSFVAAADEAVIVTTPEPTAITDAYGIIKIIATEIENLNIGLKLVVNRVKNVVEGRRVADRIISISGQFLNLKVEYLGCIYDDPAVPSSVLRQKPFIVAEPKSKAAISIHHLVSKLERAEFTDDRGIGRFIKKLFGRE